MPKWMKAVVVLGTVLFVATTAAMFVLQVRRVSEAKRQNAATQAAGAGSGVGVGGGLTPAQAAEGLSIPDFTLVDQDGRTVTRREVLGGDEGRGRGRVTILDFVFTNCPFICPMLTATMSDLAAELKGTEVRLMSISVDPEHDTPAALKAYAELHEADLSRWTFLTAHGRPEGAEVLAAILENGLKFALGPDLSTPINLPNGTTMSNIIHPSWLVLVKGGTDGGCEVLGVYKSSVPEDVRKLAADARAAAKP